MRADEWAAAGRAIHDGGWGDRTTTLRFGLQFNAGRLFVAEAEDRAIVGTSSAIQYGRTGWIGLVFVTPAWRGRGLGRELTAVALRQLRAQGCSSVLLAATQLGRRVYERLGFRESGGYVVLKSRPLNSHAPTGAGLSAPSGAGLNAPSGAGLNAPSGEGLNASSGAGLNASSGAGSSAPSGEGVSAPSGGGACDMAGRPLSWVRELTREDLPGLGRLDRQASGEDRRAVIESLLAQGARGRVMGSPGDIRAFALHTPWGLGPVVASRPADARSLLDEHFEQADASTPISAIAPSQNLEARAYLAARGLEEQRELPRMVFGQPVAWQPNLMWTIITFALG